MQEWRLGSYELVRRLGEGGMAQVYLARDIRLGREVAVKTLDRKLAERPGFRERFLREARVTATLDHPNIVPLYDFGESGVLYLVMPFVSGGSLQDMLPRAPFPIGEVATYGSQIADALAYAHQRNIVHRDVKPANMLFHADGRLMLSDFGLAKIVSSATRAAAPRNHPDAGTPEYMAPEQIGGQSDERSDIYALGVVLYLLLTGRLPFTGSSSSAVMQGHLYNAPESPRHVNAEVTPAMEAVVMRALAKRPEDRFQRASELGAALLGALIAGSGTPAPFALGAAARVKTSPPTPAYPRQRLTNPGLVAQSPSGEASAPPWLMGSVISATSSASLLPPVGLRDSIADGLGAVSGTHVLPRLDMPFTSLDSTATPATHSARSGAHPASTSEVAPNSQSPASSPFPAAPVAPPGTPVSLVNAINSLTTNSHASSHASQESQPGQTGQMPVYMPPLPGNGQHGAAPFASTGLLSPIPMPMAPISDPRLPTPLVVSNQTPVEPKPVRDDPSEKRTVLWVIIAALVMIMLLAAVILVRWLQSGAVLSLS